jgi:hypothetical protein
MQTNDFRPPPAFQTPSPESAPWENVLLNLFQNLVPDNDPVIEDGIPEPPETLLQGKEYLLIETAD